MSLLEKLDAAAAARKAQLPEGIGAFGIPIEESYSATEARIGKTSCIDAGNQQLPRAQFRTRMQRSRSSGH